MNDTVKHVICLTNKMGIKAIQAFVLANIKAPPKSLSKEQIFYYQDMADDYLREGELARIVLNVNETKCGNDLVFMVPLNGIDCEFFDV